MAYAAAMKGTSFSQTLVMDLTPPNMTTATNTAMMSDTTHLGIMGKFPHMMPVIADDWTAEPVPSVATTAKAAKRTAPSLAQKGTEPSGRLNARSQAYMAPPSICPR